MFCIFPKKKKKVSQDHAETINYGTDHFLSISTTGNTYMCVNTLSTHAIYKKNRTVKNYYHIQLRGHTSHRTEATFPLSTRHFACSTNPWGKILNISYPIAFLVNSYLAPEQITMPFRLRKNSINKEKNLQKNTI